MKEVLDSRFFAALFFERDEGIRDAARAKLRQLRRERRGLIPSVVVAEVVNLICRKGGRDAARAHHRAIEASGLQVLPVDGTDSAEAGLLLCAHRGLPLADALVAAIALRVGGRVISDDLHFGQVPGLRVAWLA